MTETKHTPGPWSYSNPTQAFGVVWAGSLEIADTAQNSLPTEQQRANAHLIAAAPDMLEALQNLKMAVNFRDAMVACGNLHQMSDAATRLNQAVEKATRAISKATGAQ